MLRLPAMSLVGEFAAGVLRTTRIDKGFFGARGLSLDRGLMDLNPDEVRHQAGDGRRVRARDRHLRPRRSGTQTALLSFVEPAGIHAIVTDSGAPAELARRGAIAASRSSSPRPEGRHGPRRRRRSSAVSRALSAGRELCLGAHAR